jgi:hypothetical protein
MALGTHQSYATGPRARFDLVIVSPEKHGKAVLKKARDAHPGALVFAYLNTMDVMLVRSTEKPSFWKGHEDWFLHGSDGERVRVRVKGYQGPRARFGMNVAHPGWQEYLGTQAAELLEMGYDGIQLDNVETDCSYRLLNVGRWISAMPVELDEEKWYAGEAAMLAKIRSIADDAGYRDREIIFNHIRSGETERSMDYIVRTDGANAEGWMDFKVEPEGRWGWRSRVDLIRRASAAGKRTNLLALASMHSPEEALFTFASYLMAFRDERSTFWYGKAYRAEEMRWFWFYDADLGAPAGEMEEIPDTGVFRRRFERGLVLVNPRKEPARVTLDGSWHDESFERLAALTLRGREGKLLMMGEAPVAGRIALEAESCLGAAAADSGSRSTSGAEGALRPFAGDDLSGGSAVAFGDTATTCRLEAKITAGSWRVIVDGRGQGSSEDAAIVKIGKEDHRVAFGFAPRSIYEIELRDAAEEVVLRGAEAGVVVDRVVLVPLEVRP